MKLQSGSPYFHTEEANSSKKIENAAVQHNIVAVNPPVTPAMQQYLACKAVHPECVLFYRMGDFYELFFEDAVKASAILGIALTKRGKHNGEDIQMCGVPAHSADGYLETLIASGCKVAICEQMEDAAEAKKRGSKSVMRREVVRIVTPGTITEDTLLDARQSNYLCCIAKVAGEYSLAWLEISTGEFYVSNPAFGLLPSEIARINPREIILSEALAAELASHEFWQEWKGVASVQPSVLFDSQKGERGLKDYYKIAALDAVGDLSRADMAACGALVEYISLTQISAMPRLEIPRKQLQNAVMAIDPATRRNLELVMTLSGSRSGSLLSVIDRTVTGGGARLLMSYLSAPLTVPQAIYARLKQVKYFVESNSLRADLRALLRQCPDMERALSRICLERGSPRDLIALKNGLETAEHIRRQLISLENLPAEIMRHLDAFGGHEVLAARLQAALKAEVPLLARDGNFVREGYSPPLDEFRMLRDESKRLIAALEGRYQQETGVNTLKIRYNNVLGYYAEVTAIHQKKITEQFIHRQSLANALRYTTTELGELERKISEAADRAIKLELEIFESLVAEIKAQSVAIASLARALSALDVAAGLAELAVEQRYVCPVLDNSTTFDIRGGRHPVVEVGLAKSGQGQFIGNDCDLSEVQRLWLLTGPNMAGKSTFLRQNALIAIMAQIGSFVPAESAHIGVVDKLFSRVGAADDLARGRSTFMVEMVETATILNQATQRSLVILDEIGRGTATFDGLSIAWAVVEHLHDQIRCRSLFATHYHEMTALAASLSALSCWTMKVKEWKGNVVFLHEVAKGAADRSYGIHVARLAGLPEPVLKRATDVLHTLEETQGVKVANKLSDDLPLFKSLPPVVEPVHKPSEVDKALAGVNPDNLTPREAMELIYKLKALAA
ncbi:MAG TPA: DNA mismatch repair protein MutS [Rickettsiales bacterium]|nr:DNA mismatch repair protein MutS [Rickettsiales bacterium]